MLILICILFSLSSSIQEWYFKSSDKKVNIYVTEKGQGEIVVVLHGGPSLGSEYIQTISDGLEDQFRFVYYDQRGSEKSYCAPEFISMAKHVEDLEKLRQDLGVERINLLGHSAGTTLALNYFAAHPDHVKHMVLVGSTYIKNGSDYYTKADFDLFNERAALQNEFANRPEVEAELKKQGLDKKNLTEKERYLYGKIKYAASANLYDVSKWPLLRHLYPNHIASRATQESTNWNYNYSRQINAHPYSVTVINGEFDYTMGCKDMGVWRHIVRDDAPKLRLVVLKQAAHVPWVDQSENFKRALKKALSDS